MNSSDSDFYQKVKAFLIIQWMTEYRNGLFIGMFSGGISTIASSITGEIGKEAAKEIAKNNGTFTKLARDLITQGTRIAKNEKILQAVINKTSWVGRKENVCDAFNAICQMIGTSKKTKTSWKKLTYF